MRIEQLRFLGSRPKVRKSQYRKFVRARRQILRAVFDCVIKGVRKSPSGHNQQGHRPAGNRLMERPSVPPNISATTSCNAERNFPTNSDVAPETGRNKQYSR